MASIFDLGRLVVRLISDASQFRTGFDQAENIMMTSGARIASMGRRMTAAFTLPLAGMGYAAATAFASFDQEITRALSLLDDRGPGTRKQMEDLATTMSEKFPYSASQMATALKEISEAGLNTETTLASLGLVAEFATAGAFRDLDHVAKMMLQSQAALGLASENQATHMNNLKRVMDAVTVASNESLTNQENLAKALTTKSAAAMRKYSIDVEAGVAALAGMAQQGIEAELAGERLDILLRDLNQSVLRSPQAWKDMGLSVYDVHGNMRSLSDIIVDLENKMQPLNDASRSQLLTMLGFQFRSQAAINSLLGMGEGIGKFEATIRSKLNPTTQMAQDRITSFTNQMVIFKNEVVNTARDAFADLLPAIEYITEAIREGITWWRSLSEETRYWTVNALAALAVAGPLFTLFGNSIWLFGGLIGVLTKTNVAVHGLASGYMQLRTALNSVLPPLHQVGTGLLNFRSYFAGFIPTIGRVWNAWVSLVDVLITGSTYTNLLSAAQARLRLLMMAQPNLLGMISAAWTKLRTAMVSGSFMNMVWAGITKLHNALVMLRAELFLVGVAVIAYFATKIYQATEDIMEFNRQIERAISLQERLMTQQQIRNNRQITNIGQIDDPAERMKAFEDAIAKARRESEGLNAAIKDAQDRVTRATESSFGQGWLPIGDKEVEQAAQNLKDLQEAYNQNQAHVDRLTDAMNDAKTAAGKLAAEQEKVARENQELFNAKQLEKYQEALEKITRDTEDAMTPENMKPALEMERMLADFKKANPDIDQASMDAMRTAYMAKIKAEELEAANKKLDEAREQKTEEMQQKAEDLAKGAKSPLERFNEAVLELQGMSALGLIDEKALMHGVKEAGKTFMDESKDAIEPDELKMTKSEIREASVDLGLSDKQDRILRLQAKRTRDYDADNNRILGQALEEQREAVKQMEKVNKALEGYGLPELKDPRYDKK